MVKVKGIPVLPTEHHVMKAYWGSGTRWRWVVSFTPRPLYLQGKTPWYPLYRRLGGPQSRSGRGGEEKNSEPPQGTEYWNPDRPTRSTALYHWAITALKFYVMYQFLYDKPAPMYKAGLRTGWSGVRVLVRGWEFISSPPRPDWFWGPLSLLSSGYQGLFSWG
jgi:hypothetical protein